MWGALIDKYNNLKAQGEHKLKEVFDAVFGMLRKANVMDTSKRDGVSGLWRQIGCKREKVKHVADMELHKMNYAEFAEAGSDGDPYKELEKQQDDNVGRQMDRANEKLMSEARRLAGEIAPTREVLDYRR